MDRVLNPNFSPRDAEDRALFEAQQNYMYAVFECTMLTDMGSSSCSGREIRGSCSRRNTARKSTMASLNGETLVPTKVVAIEPILGSVKYEARSHCHSVFRGDCIHSRVCLYVREIKMDKCPSSRKWGVTRFQQVWLNVNV